MFDPGRERPKKISRQRTEFPTNLSLGHLSPKRVLMIGSCFAEGLSSRVKKTVPDCECDFILYNFSGELPQSTPQPVPEYDFIIIMLPLRTVMPELGYLRLSYSDAAAFQSFFQVAVDRLEQLLDGALFYTREHRRPPS